MKNVAQKMQGKSCVATKGVKNVNVEKNAPSAGPVAPAETLSQEKPALHHTSNSYQKILDYHISEILLTTIIVGIILLLRLHH
jgi:hypothetical protein